MARKRTVHTKSLYAYLTPKAHAFVAAQSKKLQTPGGMSGYLDQLILAKMSQQRPAKLKAVTPKVAAA